MKFSTWLLVLAAFAYGVNYLYKIGYFDSFVLSFDHTVERTSDFVTGKDIKKAGFE